MKSKAKKGQSIETTTADGVRFSLFAPRGHQVAIQGSWNSFKSETMARGDDGVWWISFPLDDGEYRYPFEVTPKGHAANHRLHLLEQAL